MSVASFIKRLLACIGFSAMLSVQPASAQPVARVMVNDAPPYRIIGSANGVSTYSGIYIDILRLIAAELRLELDFTELPLARALRVMEAGGADIMLGPNRTPDRETYLRYLDPPLPREPKMFLQHRLAKPIQDYADLYGRRIAVLRGASYFDRFDADAALEKVELDDYTAALRLVLVGRADTVVIPEQQGQWLLRETGFDLRAAPYRVAGRDSHIVLARTSPLMFRINEIEAALRHVLESGAAARILQRYE
ncbi:MAG: transporter substrate-binding domain-containing protein [Ferrovibrio sp.]